MRKMFGVAIAATALTLSMATPALAADGTPVRPPTFEYRGVFPTERQCYDAGNRANRLEPKLHGFQCREHWTGQHMLYVRLR
jgi:hypothetical protein